MHILHPEYYKKPFFHFNRHRETKIHASPTLTTKKVTPLLTHSSPQREKEKRSIHQSLRSSGNRERNDSKTRKTRGARCAIVRNERMHALVR